MPQFAIDDIDTMLDPSEITDLHRALQKFISETNNYDDIKSSIANLMIVHDGYLQGDTFDDGRDSYKENIPKKYVNPKTIFIGQSIEPDDEEIYEEDKAMYFIIVNHPDIPLLSWSVPNYYDNGNYVIEHGTIREFLDTAEIESIL